MSAASNETLAPGALASLAVAGAVGGAALLGSGGQSNIQRGAAVVSATSAARFLTQASFGPTDRSIAAVQTNGFAIWLAQQRAMAVTATHLAFVDERLVQLKAANPNAVLTPTQFAESFWKQAITGNDQLRQRMKMALSEIFVVSFQAPAMDVRGVTSYYDMLGKHALGNYRTLLQSVALHPIMGLFLTYLSNVPANAATGQHPDQNFAREIMQLMSIGLNMLNPDGTLQTDANGNPIPTYGVGDIEGLAAVFTGFSWYAAKPTSLPPNPTFFLVRDPGAITVPMIGYPYWHDSSAKTFLGTTIPAAASPDPIGDLNIALDTIFNHPNVGPFIGKQLIQKLVTSNPSPAYVSRITAVFNDNGAGVRGDLGAVVTAILLDPEARDDTVVSSPTFGKLREPVIRLANWMRAFAATSTTGYWELGNTNAANQLDQTVLDAPSVFNFWSPGYSPPGTAMNALGLVAPEFEIADEVSVAGWINLMTQAVQAGVGQVVPSTGAPDIRPNYKTETALVKTPESVIQRLNLLLLYGSMSPNLQSNLLNAMNAINYPAGSPTQAVIQAVNMNKIWMAVFLVMISPEFLVQR